MSQTDDVITVIGRRITFGFTPVSAYFGGGASDDFDSEPDEGNEEEPCLLNEDEVANIARQAILQAADWRSVEI